MSIDLEISTERHALDVTETGDVQPRAIPSGPASHALTLQLRWPYTKAEREAFAEVARLAVAKVTQQ